MNPAESKTALIIMPQTLAAASTTQGFIDTKGYDYCTIDFIDGSIATAATALTYLQISEAETKATVYTEGTAIPALTGAAAVSTSAGFVLPAPSTSTVVKTGCNYRFNIDLKGRMRYLAVLLTPAHASSFCAVAHLFRTNDGRNANALTSPITNSTEVYQSHLVVNA